MPPVSAKRTSAVPVIAEAVPGTPAPTGQLSAAANGAEHTDVIGQLPNAARPAPLGKPGEQIYAVHFLGNRGYVVTFHRTDPLYVLDL